MAVAQTRQTSAANREQKTPGAKQAWVEIGVESFR